MKKHIFFIGLMLSGVFAICQSVSAGELHTIEKTYSGGVIDGYTFYLPKSYEKHKKSYPLILFFQGGSAVGGEVSVVNGWGIPKLLRDETDLSNTRNQYLLDSFIVVSPHMKGGNFDERQWYQQTDALKELLAEVQKNYSVDVSRRYVTGLSRGGHGTWGVAARMADEFAAAIPICGGLHGVDDFAPLKKLPIWVAHNTGDGTVDYNESVEAVEEIEKLGGDKFFVINEVTGFSKKFLKQKHIFSSYDKEGHDAWTPLYGSLELYQWMLKQRRD